MRQFPDTPEYIGLNTPIGEEYEIGSLAVEGRIPPDVEGVFFRAVPDPAFPPFVEDGGAILSGDGMVSAVRFAGGKVGFAIRYVQTERHKAEVAAGRALFGKYRNPYTDQPEAKGVDRTVANTTPVWHAGRLLMTKEDGRPYRVDPRSLETLGRHDFGGRLRSETMTAHVRIDPGDRRDVLLRLRGRRPRVDEGRVLHRRQAGQSDPRAMVRRAVLRADARFRRHRALCAVPDLSDHLRCRAREGGRRPLGARDGPRQLGRRDAALRRCLGNALVPGTEGRLLLPHDERLRRRRRPHPVRPVSVERQCLPVHPAGLGSERAARRSRQSPCALDHRSRERQRCRHRDGRSARRAISRSFPPRAMAARTRMPGC